MEKKDENVITTDACCPHCNSSFFEKGKIVNYFHRYSGEVGMVFASTIPGDYEKKITNEFGGKMVLKENELVKFFCQFCERELNFKFNENLFVINVINQHGEKLDVFRSACYQEEFTTVINKEKVYYYGKMTPERHEEIEKAAKLINEHYKQTTSAFIG